MSFITKMQMKFTRTGVDVMRKFVDKTNQGIAFATGPVNTFIRKVTMDAPWLFFVGATVVFMACPLIAYPWIKKWLLADPRVEREAERVRLCLQKGIDPFPTIQHKDYVYGNVAPAFQIEQAHAPKESSWEFQAMKRYREEKEKLIKESQADPEKGVVAMMKLREELKRAHKESKDCLDVEPAGLTFPGRPDTNVLKS